MVTSSRVPPCGRVDPLHGKAGWWPYALSGNSPIGLSRRSREGDIPVSNRFISIDPSDDPGTLEELSDLGFLTFLALAEFAHRVFVKPTLRVYRFCLGQFVLSRRSRPTLLQFWLAIAAAGASLSWLCVIATRDYAAGQRFSLSSPAEFWSSLATIGTVCWVLYCTWWGR